MNAAAIQTSGAGADEMLLPGYPTPSVGALVARAVSPRATPADRERAFAEIVHRFQDMAFGLAFAILGDAALAEDAAQESFLSAWRELDNLREPDAFPGWFRQIVRTQCNRLTRNKKLPTVSYEASPAALFAAAPERDCDPLKRAERAELTGAVHAALGALPEHERQATMLYYLGGHDQVAIATFLGVPVTTVKKRIFSARQRLRERMAPYMAPELSPEETAVQDALRARRPSRTDAFSDAVLLWRALDDNDAPAVATLLKKTKNILALCEPGTGLFPLHVAARRGSLGCVQALLAGGADARATATGEAVTPLHVLAAGSARAEIAEALLVAGADVNARDAKGRTPLYVAAYAAIPTTEDTADHWGLCELLIAKGATVDVHSAAALDRHADLEQAGAKAWTQRDPDEGGTPLHWAARAGWRKALSTLLYGGADVHAADSRGHTPLRWAAQPGRNCDRGPNRQAAKLLTEQGAKADIFTAALLNDTARVEALLAENPALANARDADGATPLLLAAWSGARGVVEHLLERGADATVWDTAGRTAATCIGRSTPDAGLYELLLAAGAAPDLKAALALGSETLVRDVLGHDPSATTPEVLEWAVDSDLPTAKLLLPFESGAAREIVHAAALGLTDAVRAILDTDPDAMRHRNGGRNTAMHRAAQRGHAEIVRLLLERGASVSAVADDGATPLHRAAATPGGSVFVLRDLLDAGADPAACDHRGETPLTLAAAANSAEAVELLAERGAPVNATCAGQQTALHRAVEQGDVAADVVRALLAHGAGVGARNYYGGTPLHVAARVDAPEVAKLLLGVGADKLARDNWYRTPLHVAAWFDAAGAAAVLLDAGIAVTELAFGYSTPLHTAAQNGSRRVVALLLERGADVNAKTDFGRTPLHDAVQGDQFDLARLLLAHSADANARNDRGMAPLHWASAAGKTDLVRLLLEHGADPSLRSGKGKTPAEHATGHGHTEVARLLETA